MTRGAWRPTPPDWEAARWEAWWLARRAAWRSALCGALPPAEGEWARARADDGMHAMIGWVRRGEMAKKARAR